MYFGLESVPDPYYHTTVKDLYYRKFIGCDLVYSLKDRWKGSLFRVQRRFCRDVIRFNSCVKPAYTMTGILMMADRKDW